MTDGAHAPGAPPRFGLVARLVSIVGHPAVLMPFAVVLSGAGRDTPRGSLLVAAGTTLAAAAAVAVVGAVQVRRGRWRHVDASLPRERRELDAVLLVCLLLAAAVLIGTGQPLAMVAGVAAGGVIVAIAHLLLEWFKVSLHVAFAALATSLVWPSLPAVGGLGALVAALMWSRVTLRRHTRHEVMAGLVLGAGVGMVLHRLAA